LTHKGSEVKTKMLLSCCFREQRSKKQKKKKSGLLAGEEEKQVHGTTTGRGEGVGLLEIAEDDALQVYTVAGGSRRPLAQERHPASRETRRLLKQRSQESLRSRGAPWLEGQAIPWIDQSPVGEQPATPGLPSPLSAAGLEVAHPSLALRPALTCPPYHHDLEGQARATRTSRAPVGELGVRRGSGAGMRRGSSPSSPLFPSASSSSLHSSEEEDRPIVRGLKKSAGFHDAGLLQEQLEEEERRRSREREVQLLEEERRRRHEETEEQLRREHIDKENIRRRDEETKKTIKEEKEEEKRRAIKETEDNMRKTLEAEFKARIAKVEEQQRAEREAEEKRFSQRLAEEAESYGKAVEEAVMEAKNEANRTISELNRQVVAERSKLVAEQMENSRQLEEEWRRKEERLQQSVAEVEEREQRWQEERSEVLAEVQRLKAEAGRMVAILAMEAEEENLSEERKLSLGQEVYSLQLVVEMRSSEVRSLRQQLALATQQLEELEATKSLLGKATARLDDLQAQVAEKERVGRQLSMEKTQLERTVTSSNKEKQRMSQNVEELQWRIRNNFDLPIVHHSRGGETRSLEPPSPLTSPSSPPSPLRPATSPCSPITPCHPRPGARSRPHSTPIPDRRPEGSPRKSSMFTVSAAMIEATTVQEDQTQTSDFSPSSDGVGSSPLEGRQEYTASLEEEQEQSDLEEADLDSLDEGLGDISSGNEAAESPSPVEASCSETLTASRAEGPGSPERRMVLDLHLSPGREERRLVLEVEVGPEVAGSPRSPAEDRRPSRVLL